MIVLCLAAVHFVIVVFTEDVVVNHLLAKVVRPIWKRLTGLGAKEEKFLVVDRELANEGWPPVTSELPIKLNASVSELRPALQTAKIHMKVVGGPEVSFASHEIADQAL